jgi:hypothetical protein
MTAGAAHVPLKPQPFRMSEWRPQWGAWWSTDNRVFIDEAIATGHVTTSPERFTELLAVAATLRGES